MKPSSPQPSGQPRIPVTDLRDGMVLARDLTDKVGRILLGAGERLTASMINRLSKWSITEVEIIPPETSDCDALAETERRESARLSRISGLQEIAPDPESSADEAAASVAINQQRAAEAVDQAISHAFAAHIGNSAMEHIANCARAVLLERIARQPSGEPESTSHDTGPDR